MDGALPVGQQISDYATQLSNMDPNAPPQRRNMLVAQAQDLSDRAEKAGAKAPDLSKVKEAAKPQAQPNLLDDLRARYPQYADVPDETLADGLYKKYYADKMPREAFDKKLSLAPKIDILDRPSTEVPSAAVPGGAGLKESVTAQKGMFTNEKENLAAQQKDLYQQRKARYAAVVQAGGNPAKDPELLELNRKYALAERQRVEDVAFLGPAQGELAGTILKGVVKGAKTIGEPVVAAVKSLTGSTAKKAIEGVRGTALKSVESAAAADEQAAVAAGKRTEELKSQQEKLRGQQPRIAEQRAIDKTRPPAPGQQAGVEAKSVKTVLDERVNELSRQYEAAGKTTQEAKVAAQEHQTLTSDAKAAVDSIDKELSGKKGISKQDYGKQLYEKTREIQEKYTEERAIKSGYAAALDAAGDKPLVDTSGARAAIDYWLTKINTLSTDPLLERLKSKLITEIEGEGADRLSVPKADSLRKTLNEIVLTKISGESAVDSETVKVISTVRDALKDAIDTATPALQAARAKWAELSTPLNIVSEKGPLGKVVEINARSRDAAMAGAEIAGHVIREANAGHGVFTRLIAESPQLRESSRLYFVQDLFGKSTAPTVKTMESWLETNENSLRQLGLYDEFSSLANAKQAAQRAVKEAEGTLKQTEKQARAAEINEAGIAKTITRQNKLRAKLTSDMEKRQAVQPTKEGMQADSAKRAEEGVSRLEKRQAAASKEQQTRESSAHEYKGFAARLGSTQLVDKQVPGETRSALKKLYSDKRIDEKVYKESLEQVNAADAAGMKRDALRKKMRDIFYAATVASALGYAGYRSVRAILD